MADDGHRKDVRGLLRLRVSFVSLSTIDLLHNGTEGRRIGGRKLDSDGIGNQVHILITKNVPYHIGVLIS